MLINAFDAELESTTTRTLFKRPLVSLRISSKNAVSNPIWRLNFCTTNLDAHGLTFNSDDGDVLAELAMAECYFRFSLLAAITYFRDFFAFIFRGSHDSSTSSSVDEKR